jgi:hypothetical protein
MSHCRLLTDRQGPKYYSGQCSLRSCAAAAPAVPGKSPSRTMNCPVQVIVPDIDSFVSRFAFSCAGRLPSLTY